MNRAIDIASEGSVRGVILFDGVCNLCSDYVEFVIKRDPDKYFVFAALQSETGLLLGDRYDISGLDSVILIDQGSVYRRSSAALRICAKLHWLWPLLRLLLVIPVPVRDWVYDYIGNHRYQWFGIKQACWVPDPSLNVSDRFL